MQREALTWPDLSPIVPTTLSATNPVHCILYTNSAHTKKTFRTSLPLQRQCTPSPAFIYFFIKAYASLLYFVDLPVDQSFLCFTMLFLTPFSPVVFGGLFALVAIVLSIRHISLHLRHYSKPQFQLHIIRILAMVPIYSFTSWTALLLTDERHILLLELLRDSYEAYVVYNFVILLINYAGGHLHLCRYLEDQPRMPHPWPLTFWLQPLRLGPAFLNSIRVSVLQFVFVKPAGAFLKLYVFWHASYVARTVVGIILGIANNLSVSCALYGLVLFYHAAHELLLPHKPFEKFLAVKSVVFFSFWQGVALSIAVNFGMLTKAKGLEPDDQASRAQDTLICFEMAVAAIMHYYVFSSTEYENEDSDSGAYPLLHVVDIRDVLSDAKDRINGGVGYGNELREKEPILPSVDNILGDAVEDCSLTYSGARYTVPVEEMPSGTKAAQKDMYDVLLETN